MSQKKLLFLTQVERGLDQMSQKNLLFLTPPDRLLDPSDTYQSNVKLDFKHRVR